jgi:hypothetical protein
LAILWKNWYYYHLATTTVLWIFAASRLRLSPVYVTTPLEFEFSYMTVYRRYNPFLLDPLGYLAPRVAPASSSYLSL